VVNWEWSYNLENGRGEERNGEELDKALIEWTEQSFEVEPSSETKLHWTEKLTKSTYNKNNHWNQQIKKLRIL